MTTDPTLSHCRRLAAALLLLLTAACAPTRGPAVPRPSAPAPGEARLALTRVSFDALPGWRDDDHGAALPALINSCARLMRRGDAKALGIAGIGGRIAQWRPLCAAARRLDAGDAGAARGFFETWFSPYLATAQGNAEGLFTGYYEASLRGAWTPHGRYRVPIHGRPAELVSADLGKFRAALKGENISGRVVGGRLVPFQTRADIERGALAGRGLELLWVDDPVDAFFLHIQGSGRVDMEDGRVVRLGFAGRNGRAYVAIGRRLVEQGAIARKDMSMQAIRAWLRAHPAGGAALMASNPSYIFFRAVDGPGPIGAHGAALTPGRSLAVDKRFVPFGLPVWLDTTNPLDRRRPLRRLLIAQDTGGAIRGAVRGDVFWGWGDAAARMAGAMNERGRYYLLLPRAAAP